MESVQSIVSLQDSTSDSELLELLHTLTVPKLKLLCKENATKTSENKADMISFKYCVVMNKYFELKNCHAIYHGPSKPKNDSRMHHAK